MNLSLSHGRVARWHLLGTSRRTVAVVALVVNLVVAVLATRRDLLFLYDDARSHLTIARRLIDGPNDGIVQLGTVWLPLPHVLLLPFVASRWLWHTGWAAIPVDAICLAIESTAVWSITRRLTHNHVAA
jgi:hypothetical protein